MSRRKKKACYWQDAPIAREQLVLIPQSLELLIGEDHPVRLVDEILDSLDWSMWESRYHGERGQPPIHPSVLAKAMLFALIRRIQSSRRIEYEIKHSIDFIWLVSGRRIDHTTISEFRRKHKDELRDIFKQMVKCAIDMKVANLSELCIDGTRVLASANRRKTWTSERLEKALELLDKQIVEAMNALETQDAQDSDLLGDDVSADRLPPDIADLEARRKKLEEVLENTQAMDEARKKKGTKGASQIPKTDPDSRVLPSKQGGYAPNYTPMATTETGAGMIVDADVVIGNVEHDQLHETVKNVEENFDVEVERMLADSAYVTGENLTQAEKDELEIIGPIAQGQTVKENPAIREDPTQPVAAEDIDKLPKNGKSGRFARAAFLYDEEKDVYYCPAGKELAYDRTKQATSSKPELRVYTCPDCAGCTLLSLCKQAKDSRGREIEDDQHEGARRRQRKKMASEEAKTIYNRRFHFGEVPFAVIKQMFDLRRFLLRGIEGVRQQWRWAATAFNLKKLMAHWPPVRAASAPKPAPAAS